MSINSNKPVEELLNIGDIVDGKLFKIPDYQRGYSWDKEQVMDLIKDLEQVQHQDYMHYTGTLVISKPENSMRYDVVDGQQRLSTILILLKVIYEYDKKKYSELFDRFIVRPDGNYILEMNKETEVFFRQAILGDNKSIKADIKSLKNLKSAKKLLTKWINNGTNSVDTIKDAVLHKLGFLCFSPKNTKEIGIMFEVINNRGKELSELEKIKNYFIYYATINSDAVLKNKVNDSWGTILKYLSKAKVVSNQEENNYLRNCYLVFYSPNKSKSWHAYNQLKDRYPVGTITEVEDNLSEISKFIDFLISGAQSYGYFFKSGLFLEEYNDILSQEISYILRQLRCHPVNASIMPLYLASMFFLRSKPENVLELLEHIEKTNFRTYVLPNPNVSRADSRQGDLFHWANVLFDDPDWDSEKDEEEYFTWLERKIVGNIFDYIKLNLEDFTKAMCPEKVFIQSLTVDEDESIDYYNWQGLRYFLACYEEYKNSGRKETWNIEKILKSRKEVKKDKLNDYLSKEHIWASKNNKKYFNEKWIDKRRLGNFVLLGLSSNMNVQDWNIEDKIDYFLENASISMIQVDELVSLLEKATKLAQASFKVRKKGYYNILGKFILDNRETELIKFALKRWKFEDEVLDAFIEVDSIKAEKEGRNEKYYIKEKKVLT